MTILNGPGVEPVAVFAYRRKGLDYFCTCDEDRYNELAQKPNLFEVAVFYTAPSAPAQTTECDECHDDPSLCDIHDCGDAHKTTAKMQAPVQAVPDGELEQWRKAADVLLSGRPLTNYERRDAARFLQDAYLLHRVAPQPPKESTAQSVVCPTDKEK